MGRAIGTVECETDAIVVEITVSFEAAVFVGFVLTRAVLIVGFEIVRISLAVWTAFEWVIAATMVFETAERIMLSCSVLTKLESLDARNRAAVAISSGRPIVPRGMSATNASMASFGTPSRMGVSMVPGLRTFTRMFRAFRSTVQVRANERRAALLAL